MPADFTPSLLPFSGQGPFRYWCQTVLPLVYDDSLSYYELLNKVVDYLNKALADVANLGTNVDSLENAYVQLQNYVNEYFYNLDVQSEINEKLDNMAESGELAELVSPIVSVEVSQWLQEHITPTSPAVDKSLTVDGAAADSAVVGNKVGELESDIASAEKEIDNLISLNSFDIFQHIADGTRVDKGVTFVSDGKGKYTVNGTATGSSFCNISDFNLPDRYKTGVDYYLVFDAGNSALKLRFYCYDVNGNLLQGYPTDYTSSKYTTIPTGTKRFLARLQVDNGNSVNNVVVEPKLLTAQSNNYLERKVTELEGENAENKNKVRELEGEVTENKKQALTYMGRNPVAFDVEIGSISQTTGSNTDATQHVRSGMIPYDENIIIAQTNNDIRVRSVPFFYDSGGNYLGYHGKAYQNTSYALKDFADAMGEQQPNITQFRLAIHLNKTPDASDIQKTLNSIFIVDGQYNEFNAIRNLLNNTKSLLESGIASTQKEIDNLISLNSFDIFQHTAEETKTNYGVTFVSDGKGKYTVNGTSTGNAFYNISDFNLPDRYKTGVDYYLVFDSNNSALKLRFYCYGVNGNTLQGYPKDYTVNQYIHIPTETKRILARLQVDNGDSVNNVVVEPKLLTAQSNNYLERKVYNNEIGLLDLLDYNSRNVLPYLPKSEPWTSKGVTGYTDGFGNYTLNGTASGAIFWNIVSNAMPNGMEAGGTYKLIFETDSDIKIRVYCYNENGTILPGYPSDYGTTRLIKIPIETNNLIIRIQIPSGAVLNNTTISPKIINSPTNSELDERLTNLEMTPNKVTKPIFYISEEELHLVRCEWDDNFDIISAFQYPGSYNRNFNFADVKVIPKATEFNDTVTAYNNADTYKKANDDVSPLRLNGYFIGANHGNPNFTKVDTNGHDKTETDIGSRWSNGTNVLTLVVIDGNSLIFGWLNSQNELEPIISSSAFTLTHASGATHSSSISATSSTSYQLRNACNNISVKVLNENNTPITSGETAEKIVVVEEYDIIDQSKILTYLQNKVGQCTNSSYYSNDITTLMGHVSNKWTFFRNGSVLEALGFQAKDNLTFNYWYGLQSQNFTDDDFVNNRVKIYAPNSSAKNIVPLTTTSYLDISKDNGAVAPYRYYQLRSDYTKAFFSHYIQVGAASNDNRIELSVAGAVSITNGARFKLYGRMDQTEREMSNGDIVQYMAVRGPMKTSANQTVMAWWWEGDTIILCLDFHQSFTGPVKLPAYMVGKKVTIVDDGGLEVDNFVGSLGLNVSSNNYSYAVMKLTD